MAVFDTGRALLVSEAFIGGFPVFFQDRYIVALPFCQVRPDAERMFQVLSVTAGPLWPSGAEAGTDFCTFYGKIRIVIQKKFYGLLVFPG